MVRLDQGPHFLPWLTKSTTSQEQDHDDQAQPILRDVPGYHQELAKLRELAAATGRGWTLHLPGTADRTPPAIRRTDGRKILFNVPSHLLPRPYVEVAVKDGEHDFIAGIHLLELGAEELARDIEHRLLQDPRQPAPDPL